MKSVMNTKAALLVAAALFVGGAASAQELLAYNGKTPAATVATGNDAPALKMDIAQGTKAEGLTFHINVENPNLERVKLYLLDKTGSVLHEELLPAKAHFETRYNLDQLEDGSYKIVLSTRDQEIKRAINIATSVSRSGKVN
ncbi:hypothetical protein DCC81_02305 [Chitinophaga parva]|uniref:Secretion system C-terminal sorting domain-containing protein n=1 Tax=Chitinophaga parva TaxID=2169414 RepID=A0A2T7BKY3_9BACT|nr:hypothetical protein [Chitinophaga parva]PUZ28337.1 hypothetical protein DCC81_02305 [Chitinophaga parva]